MRQVINDLFRCINEVTDKQSRKDLARIIRRELELDLQDAGIVSDNLKPTPREIRLANDGKKLEAVKLYKKRTGSSLIDAKHAIEAEMDMVGRKNSDYRPELYQGF